MGITDSERTEIFSRLGELEGKSKINLKSNNNGSLKAFSGVLVIAALIGAIAAIVRPIQQQIDVIHNRIERIENRIENQIKSLGEKLQIEVKMSNERTKDRLKKLEEWQKWWYKSIPIKNATQDEKIRQIEKELKNINKIEGK